MELKIKDDDYFVMIDGYTPDLSIIYRLGKYLICHSEAFGCMYHENEESMKVFVDHWRGTMYRVSKLYADLHFPDRIIDEEDVENPFYG